MSLSLSNPNYSTVLCSLITIHSIAYEIEKQNKTNQNQQLNIARKQIKHARWTRQHLSLLHTRILLREPFPTCSLGDAMPWNDTPPIRIQPKEGVPMCSHVHTNNRAPWRWGTDAGHLGWPGKGSTFPTPPSSKHWQPHPRPGGRQTLLLLSFLYNQECQQPEPSFINLRELRKQYACCWKQLQGKGTDWLPSISHGRMSTEPLSVLKNREKWCLLLSW